MWYGIISNNNTAYPNGIMIALCPKRFDGARKTEYRNQTKA
jgi:hypothetical protein